MNGFHTTLSMEECRLRLGWYVDEAALYGYATRSRQTYHGNLVRGQVTETGFRVQRDETRWSGFEPVLVGKFTSRQGATRITLETRTTVWRGLAPAVSVVAIVWSGNQIARRTLGNGGAAQSVVIAVIVVLLAFLYVGAWTCLTLSHVRFLRAFVRDVLAGPERLQAKGGAGEQGGKRDPGRL